MTEATRSIAKQVEVLAAGMSTQMPAAMLDAFADEQARLANDGIPAGVVHLGTRIPDGDLLDAHGMETTLARVRSGKAAVVVFYRGAWCPYCNLTLRTYQHDLAPALTERGVDLIAISPQKPDGSLSMQEKPGLTFTVLSDPGNQIAAQLGILTAPSEGVRDVQAALGLDLAEINLDGTYGLPMPAVAIIDAAGFLRWIDVHPDYTTRSETADIISAVDASI